MGQGGGVTDASVPTGRRARDPRVSGLALVATMVAVMWVEEVVDRILGGDLDRFGIAPRSEAGLPGIVAAPFLHASFGHLISNTIPFVLMGATIALSGLIRVLSVTVIVALASGVGTWLVASPGTVHLGASGVVFGYATYLIARGIYSRNLIHLGVGLIVGALFGGALLGGLSPHEGISWQGHLFGGLGGLLAARLLARPPRAKPPAEVALTA
jgi:membrane associated rhomboid family serine protease